MTLTIIELTPTVRSLLNFLGGVRAGAVPVTFTARTRVTLLKKNRETKEPCPYLDAWKTAIVNGMLQCDYGKAMERRTGEPHEYKEVWHAPVLDDRGRLTPCSRDKHDENKLYLRVQDPRTLSASYTADGTPIDWETLAPYVSGRPDDAPVVGFKVYGLDKIESVTIDRETWTRPLFTFETPEEV